MRKAVLLLSLMGITLVLALGTRRLVPNLAPIDVRGVAPLASLAVALCSVSALDWAMRRYLPLRWLNQLATLFGDQLPKKLAVERRRTSVPRLQRASCEADAARATAAATVLRLLRALTAHDRRTRGHCERVRAVSMVLADQLRIPADPRERLEWAALLHDVGKIGVSVDTLNKPGPLNAVEWGELHAHPAAGTNIAAEMTQWLGDSAHVIDQHHERYDGNGYPAGLKGPDIALSARVVAVADAFEVITANRSYKRAMTLTEGREQLIASSGSHFDPHIVRAFVTCAVRSLPQSIGVIGWTVALWI